MDTLGCIQAWLIWQEQQEQSEVPEIQISSIPGLLILILILTPLIDLHPVLAAQLLARESRGQEVVALQNDLKQAGCMPRSVRSTGYYGKITKAAVQKLQRTHGLRVDGVVGEQTRNALDSGKTCQSLASSGILKMGSRGEKVRELQSQLNKWSPLGIDEDLMSEYEYERQNKNIASLDLVSVEENSIFDEQTQNAVLIFQKYHGLQQDGIVGLQTSQILSMPLGSASIRLLNKKDPNLKIRGLHLLRLRRIGLRNTRNSLCLWIWYYGGSVCPGGGVGDIASPDVKAAIPQLVALLNDENTNVRISAANTLMWIGSKSVPLLATPTLIELLTDKNPNIREAASIALLSQLPDASILAVNPVIKLLENKEESVGLLLNVFLVHIQAKDAVQPLIKLLADPDSDVRASAVKALENIQEKASIQPLIKLLANPKAYVRAGAVEELGNIKSQDAVQPLIKLLADPDSYVKAKVIEALGNIQAKDAVQPLIKLLDNSNIHTRRRAVEALGNIKSQDAVQPLIKLLEDSDIHTRKRAIIALGNIQSQDAVQPLVKLLAYPDSNVRVEAVEALGNIQSQDAVQPLVKLLADDPDSYEVIEALGNIKSQDAVQPLVKLLAYPDRDVRARAAKALGNIKSQDAVQPLIKLLELESYDSYVRENIFEALGNIKSQEAVQPLINLLKTNKIVTDDQIEEYNSTRISTAEFLGNIQAQEAVEPLIKLLEDKDVSVRASAVKALVKINPQAIQELLVKVWDNRKEDWEVRLNAFAALAQMDTKVQSAIEPRIKTFVIEALQYNPSTPQENYWEFYEGKPYYKRHAFFLATIEARSFPGFDKALREILKNKNYQYKVRYSVAFILGHRESNTETITQLKSVVHNPKEDFDIRWISAFSLAKMGQDMNQFFIDKKIINPIKINCKEGDMFDPFTGWCEQKDPRGGRSIGWARTFQSMQKSPPPPPPPPPRRKK